MKGMVKIIVPLSIQFKPSGSSRTYETRVIERTFGDQIDLPIEFLCPVMDGFRKFLQEGNGRLVKDFVDCIQTQSIKPKVRDPIKGVQYEETANLIAEGTIKVDGVPPRSLVSIRKIGTKARQVIAFRTQVVVNNIQNDSQTVIMAGAD